MEPVLWFQLLWKEKTKPADIELAIMRGADVNWKDDRGWTALHCITPWDTWYCPLVIAQVLLQHKADPTIVRNKDEDCTTMAYYNNLDIYYEIIKQHPSCRVTTL